MGKDSLSITDNRTGKTYEVPVQDGAIRATALRQIKVGADDFGLMTYDPAFMNTASCRSAITFIDGDLGVLWYRGYPIDQLAEKSTYLETAYLLVHGALPDARQLRTWVHEITHHTMVHEKIKALMEGFRHDAHPMGMLLSMVGALSTFYPDARNVADADERRLTIVRLIAKIPTLAAWAYRHTLGFPYIYPDNDLSFTGNFLSMMFKMVEPKYQANKAVEQALDVLFILHADHEQNCSANAMRAVGSSRTDPYSSAAAAIAALYGPLHGGANEEALRMLRQIGSVAQIPGFIKKVKSGEGRLMGFGHRVYKNFDPRAKVMKATADEVLKELGKSDPVLDVAKELEQIALKDDYFVEKKLYPNVDFYSGVILNAIGFPTDMFTALFALARTVGWVAQWNEMISDPEQKIGRPRQLYTGATQRDYVPVDRRS